MSKDSNLPRIKSIILTFVRDAFIEYNNETFEDQLSLSSTEEDLEDQIYEFATDAMTEIIPDDTPPWEYPEKETLIEWAREMFDLSESEQLSEDEILDSISEDIYENFDNLFDDFLKELLKGDQGWLEHIETNDFNLIITNVKKEVKEFLKNNPLG